MLEIIECLIQIYIKVKDFNKAIELLQIKYKIIKEIHGVNDLQSAKVLKQQAQVLIKLNKYSEALKTA